MSTKRPLSPESTNGHLTNDQRALKRFKLHSIIQELRNEEANLVILKKLRASQQILSRHSASTNGHHSTATRVLPPTSTSIKSNSNVGISTLPNSTSRSSISSNVVGSTATRKPTVPANMSVPSVAAPASSSLSSSSAAAAAAAKVSTQSMKTSSSSSSLSNANSTNFSLEERKAQSKAALRLRLERDLLNIPSPKPLLQDILFVPNPNSLEFQPHVGLEDVVQCLYELQNDRHRLPQRFTDRAQIDEPFVCDHCGTDYTIRWWKHLNTTNSQTNILCDRCKKHVTRRTLKSDHSALLKSVFVSAMEQEKEIEKSFQALIKQQQKNSASATRSSSSSTTTSTTSTTTKVPTSSRLPAPSPLPSSPLSTYNIPSVNLPINSKPKNKSSIPQTQNFATKLSQQQSSNNATRKSNIISSIPTSTSTKNPLPAHQHHHQQQFRSSTSLTVQQQQQQQQQQAKQLQMAKMSKNASRQSSAVPSSRPNYLPSATSLVPGSFQAVATAAAAAAMLHHPALSAASTHHNARPTATKRRTLPSVPMK